LQLIDVHPPKWMEESFFERVAALMRKLEAFPQVCDFDRVFAHVSSAR
jgi:hypothetical protein